MANAFNSLVDQYTTNVKNNIEVWSFSRIKAYFKLQQYELNLFGHNITDIDVKNATIAVMFNDHHWMQMIPIFINIQRLVFDHHQQYELLNNLYRRHYRDPANNAMPSVKRPPKIRNFHVIPIHNFQVKHIRIDSHCFYQFACKLGALKLTKGKRGQVKNIEHNTQVYREQITDLQNNCKLRQFAEKLQVCLLR